MARYLVGPDGIRVEPVELHGSHLIFARMVDPAAQEGAVWYRVTRNGAAVRMPGYVPDIEAVAELVPLAELHGPDEADSETA